MMMWIDRYLAAIGDKLPAKQRDDILQELRSLLLDALENRTGGQEPSDDDVLAVIAEFGPPEAVAQRYAPKPRYVIGPRLYDTYVTVTKVLLALALFGLGVATVVEFVRSDVSVIMLLFTFLGRALSALVSVVGWSTLIFAIIERTTAADGEPQPDDGEPNQQEDASWNPRNLPHVPAGERINMGEQVFSLVLAVVALAAANYLALRLGIYGLTPVELTPELQVLNKEAVAQLLPWWNGLWLAGLVVDAAVLARRRWNMQLRIGALAVDLGSIALLVALASAQLLIGDNIVALGGSEHAEELQTAARVAPQALRGVFIAAIFFTLWDMGEHLVALVKAERRRPKDIA